MRPGAAAGRIRRIWRTFRLYSEMHDSPRQRWWEYLVETFTSESLSNVFLGGVASALAAVITGQASVWFFVVAVGLWLIVFGIYGIGNELQYAYMAARREIEDHPRGFH